MKIAICEDNRQDLTLFQDLCTTYSEIHQKPIEVTHFSSGEEFLKGYAPQTYDAIFLDIYMKELTGIATAKQIRTVDEEVKIIFTTTSMEHYSDGFSVEATHYLIKPLTSEKIEQAMHRLRNLFDKDEPLLVLVNGVKTIQIPQKEVLYIETIRNGIEVYGKHEVFAVRMPLAKAAEQLTDSRFLQCHRYSIVNLNEVVSVSNATFLMSDGKQILIRKANQKEIEQRYHQYRIAQLRGESNDR